MGYSPAQKGAPLLGKKAVPETGHYCEILYGGVKVDVDSIQIWAELLL